MPALARNHHHRRPPAPRGGRCAGSRLLHSLVPRGVYAVSTLGPRGATARLPPSDTHVRPFAEPKSHVR